MAFAISSTSGISKVKTGGSAGANDSMKLGRGLSLFEFSIISAFLNVAMQKHFIIVLIAQLLVFGQS
jgi:hypothetical protein